MPYWIGTLEAITAAEAEATKIVLLTPEYKDGIRLPKEQWITEHWATPIESIDKRWLILAYDGLNVADVELISDEEALDLIPEIEETNNGIQRHTS